MTMQDNADKDNDNRDNYNNPTQRWRTLQLQLKHLGKPSFKKNGILWKNS